MHRVLRLIDADRASLDARVSRAVGGAVDCGVTRFTYWYTGRPPVYEAIVSRPATPSPAR